MRLNILTRLLSGYLIILLGSSLISGLVIFELRDFSVETNQILVQENRIQEYTRKLTDALLSQSRFEKKYSILKDPTIYDQYLQAQEDFRQQLAEVRTIPGGERERGLLARIAQAQQIYSALIEEVLPVPRLKNRAALKEWERANEEREQTKEEAVNQLIGQLEQLRISAQQNNLERIRKLGEAQETSLRFIIYIGAVALGLIVVISVFITRSITRPIARLVEKTKEMAQGNYAWDLKIQSPPEVARLSQAFNAMGEQLNKIDTMKSDFFSVMSHELRTPLTSIREGTSLLLEGVGGTLNDKQQKLMGIVSEESNRLIGLVNSLLDLTKMEAGMMHFHFSRTNPLPLFTIAAQLLEPLLVNKKIALRLELPASLPAVPLDNDRILQVLKNLLGNAIKFTPEGGVITVAAGVQSGVIQVSIKDNGPGISGDQLQRIFEKFRQVPAPGAPIVKGTGLGLAIVKQIITAHGGKVWAESKPGRGSTFHFTLPLS
jgi:two-component system, NtrC family, sensor histidine kinase GlrK